MILSADTNPECRVVTPPVNPSITFYSRPTNPYYVSHRSYLALRLVCRTWNAIITPFAFSRLVIVSIEASLKRLAVIANDQNLRHYVKTYEYSFWREGFPQSLQQEYLFIESLPDGLKPLGYSRLEPGMHQRVLHFAAQLEFERSGEVVRGHLDSLPKFPNLERLSILVGPYESSNLSDVPSRCCRWGPAMVQAFLRALGERRVQSGVRPIRHLKLEGLTGECFLLPPSTVQAAVRGFETLQSIQITIVSMNESSTTLFGRFMQNAKQLQRINIERVSGVVEGVPKLLLRSFISPAKVDMSCKARGPYPPPIVRWPELRSLSICEFIFTPVLLIEFMRHHPNLRKLRIDNCFLKPNDIIPCPHHAHAASSPAPDEEAESIPERQTWQHVFRTIASLRKEPLERVNLTYLVSGDTEHIHISNDELVQWNAFLMGKRTTEPEALEGDEGWCAVCNPDPEDDLYHAYWDPNFDLDGDSEEDLSDSDLDGSDSDPFHNDSSDDSGSDNDGPFLHPFPAAWFATGTGGGYVEGSSSNEGSGGIAWDPNVSSPISVTNNHFYDHSHLQPVDAEEVGEDDDDDDDTIAEYGYGYGQADATQEDEDEAGNLRDPNNDYGEEARWDPCHNTFDQGSYETDDNAGSDN